MVDLTIVSLERYVEAVEEIKWLRARIDELNRELTFERQANVAYDSEWTPSPQLSPQIAKAVQMTLDEYAKAKAKHGDKVIDGPGYTNHERLTILMEEVGEAAHEMTYDAQPDGVEGGALGRLEKELTQVAAMALGWLSAVIPPGTAVVPGPPNPDQWAGTELAEEHREKNAEAAHEASEGQYGTLTTSAHGRFTVAPALEYALTQPAIIVCPCGGRWWSGQPQTHFLGCDKIDLSSIRPTSLNLDGE